MILLPNPTYCARFLALFILATSPLIFGAVHPIVQSVYVGLVLSGLGLYLLFEGGRAQRNLIQWPWVLPVLSVLLFVVLQSLPLPFSWVEWLSPLRAERMHMVNTLAQGQQHSLAMSDQGTASLHQASLFFALILYYYAIKALFHVDHSFVHAIVLTITILGLAEALYGLLQFVNPKLGILWLAIPSRAAYGTVIYKNQYATLLNLCWPLTFAVAINGLQRHSLSNHAAKHQNLISHALRTIASANNNGPLYFFATGVMMLAVFFSLSRGGIIALLLVFIFLCLSMPLTTKAKAVTILLFLIFLAGYGSLLGFHTLLDRFSTLADSGAARWDIFFGSLQMLRDHWLTGIGLGSYTFLSPVYLKNFPADLHFDHAHNEYLEFAIELGVPAALFLAGWFGYVLFLAGKILFFRPAFRVPRDLFAFKVFGTAALCAIVGFLIHGIMDFGWRLPANLFIVVTLAALVSFAVETINLTLPKDTASLAPHL